MTKRTASLLLLLGVVASVGALAAEPQWNGPALIVESRVSPTFPPAALQAKLAGVVTVSAQVLADGTVGEINVVDTSAAKLGFEEAAIDAVSQWVFEPATLDGLATEAFQLVRLHFTPGPNRMNPGFVAASFATATSTATSSAAMGGVGKAGGTATAGGSFGIGTPDFGGFATAGARGQRKSGPAMRIPRCGGPGCAYRTSDIMLGGGDRLTTY